MATDRLVQIITRKPTVYTIAETPTMERIPLNHLSDHRSPNGKKLSSLTANPL